MTKIEEIKNRLDATTPGTWSFSLPQQTLLCDPPRNSIQVQTEGGFFYSNGEEMQMSRADIEFMAHAREDVDYLLKLVEKIAEAIPADAVK